MSNYILCTQG